MLSSQLQGNVNAFFTTTKETTFEETTDIGEVVNSNTANHEHSHLCEIIAVQSLQGNKVCIFCRYRLPEETTIIAKCTKCGTLQKSTACHQLHQPLQQLKTSSSLEAFKRSFRGRIHHIWNGLESECLQTPSPDWTACRRELQRELMSRIT